METSAMTPHGLALKAYFEGETDATILVHRDDGLNNTLPAKHFFRNIDEFSPIEKLALDHCRGHVLDIGAGAGIHSLVLQSGGLRVTAIDISPEAVSIMQKKGVKNVQQADIFKYKGGLFDTLLMLGHGIGITGTLEGLDNFLVQARDLLRTDGQILLDSSDVSKTDDEKHLAYHETNRAAGRYMGEIRIRMEFQGIRGPVFDWLHVDPGTLAKHAIFAGWKCEILLEQESGEYLARLV